MKTINMHEAKTNLSKVVAELSRTHGVYVICRNGKPVAELRAYVPAKNVLRANPKLKVRFKEDPSRPLDPRDWPEAFE